MKKLLKPILILGSFALLLYLILFTEKKQEDAPLMTLWKIDIDEVIYHPPTDSSYKDYLQNKIRIRRDYPNLKAEPLFIVESVDSKNSYQYEGGYNAKNLLRELSVPKTVYLEQVSKKRKKKFAIKNSSPYLEAYKNGKLEKKIFIGKDDYRKRYKFALADKEIFKLYAFTANRFTKSELTFRDRSLFYSGNQTIEIITFQTDNENIQLTSKTIQKDKKKDTIWYKKKGNRSLRISPSLGRTFLADLKKISITRFPDEDKEDGFLIINELVKEQPRMSINLFLSNGLHYFIRIFPRVTIEGKVYNPVITEIKERFQESPYYIDYSKYQKLTANLQRIQNAKEWQTPQPMKKPIQKGNKK